MAVGKQFTGGDPQEKIPLLALLWFSALNEIAHQDHLVRDLLLAASLFVVFGESNSGKTFWLLDLCLALAGGQPWRGRAMHKGLVIYVAGEGAASVRMRVAAYRTAHPEVSGGLPFAIVPFAVDFLSAESVDCLIATIRAAESEVGEKAVLIVIDTFARSIPGGNENDAQDVGLAVAAADRIRLEVNACVGFVHHAGKDPSKGARGSSALRAAVDTEILIEGGFAALSRPAVHTATVTKQRDLLVAKAMPFELVPVTVGTHADDGADITSCVVKQVHREDLPTDGPQRAKKAGKNQEKAAGALKEWLRGNPEAVHIRSEDIKNLLKTQGLGFNRRPEVLVHLVNIRVLTPSIGGYTIDKAMLS